MCFYIQIYGSSLRKIRSLEDYVSNLYPSPRSSRFLKMKRIKISCYKNQKRDFCNLVIILKKQINIGEFTFISQLQETNFFLFIRISHIISQPSQDSKDRNMNSKGFLGYNKLELILMHLIFLLPVSYQFPAVSFLSTRCKLLCIIQVLSHLQFQTNNC